MNLWHYLHSIISLWFSKETGGGESTEPTSLVVTPAGGVERPLGCTWQTNNGWLFSNSFTSEADFTLPNVLIGGYVVLYLDSAAAESLSGFNPSGAEIIDSTGLDPSEDTSQTSLVVKITSANPFVYIKIQH